MKSTISKSLYILISAAAPAIVSIALVKAVYLIYGNDDLADFIYFRRTVALVGPIMMFGQYVDFTRKVATRNGVTDTSPSVMLCMVTIGLTTTFGILLMATGHWTVGGTLIASILIASASMVPWAFVAGHHRGMDDGLRYAVAICIPSVAIPAISIGVFSGYAGWGLPSVLLTWAIMQVAAGLWFFWKLLHVRRTKSIVHVDANSLLKQARMGFWRVVGDACLYLQFLLPIVYANDPALVGVALVLSQAVSMAASPLSVRWLPLAVQAIECRNITKIIRYVSCCIICMSAAGIAYGVWGQALLTNGIGLLTDDNMAQRLTAESPDRVLWIGAMCVPYALFVSTRSVLDGFYADKSYALIGTLSLLASAITVYFGHGVGLAAFIGVMILSICVVVQILLLSNRFK